MTVTTECEHVLSCAASAFHLNTILQVASLGNIKAQLSDTGNVVDYFSPNWQLEKY